MISTIAPAPTRDLRDLIVEHFQEQHRALGLPTKPKPARRDLTCEPPWRWVGGKRELLAQRPDAFPPAEDVRCYHEPFCGGAAIFFLRYAGVPAVLNDTNRWLSLALRYLKTRPDAVIGALRELVEAYNAWSEEDTAAAQAFYLLQRERFHAPRMEPAERAALFIFFLLANFNGLWRVNQEGRYNVGWGKEPRLTLDVPKLLTASRALSSVAAVRNVDFEETILDHVDLDERGRPMCWGRFAAQEGDFVYFDPPYAAVSKTASFNAYSAGGDWRPKGKDRLRLAELMHTLRRRGVRFLGSDADTPETREVYAGLHIETVMMGRSVNSRGDRRGAVSELLICGEKPR